MSLHLSLRGQNCSSASLSRSMSVTLWCVFSEKVGIRGQLFLIFLQAFLMSSRNRRQVPVERRIDKNFRPIFLPNKYNTNLYYWSDQMVTAHRFQNNRSLEHLQPQQNYSTIKYGVFFIEGKGIDVPAFPSSEYPTPSRQQCSYRVSWLKPCHSGAFPGDAFLFIVHEVGGGLPGGTQKTLLVGNHSFAGNVLLVVHGDVGESMAVVSSKEAPMNIGKLIVAVNLPDVKLLIDEIRLNTCQIVLIVELEDLGWRGINVKCPDYCLVAFIEEVDDSIEANRDKLILAFQNARYTIFMQGYTLYHTQVLGVQLQQLTVSTTHPNVVAADMQSSELALDELVLSSDNQLFRVEYAEDKSATCTDDSLLVRPCELHGGDFCGVDGYFVEVFNHIESTRQTI